MLNLNARSKAFCFTYNNYTESDMGRLAGMPDRGDCRYILFGRETGELGTPHLQGYCEFARRTTLRRAISIIGPRSHVEVRGGTQEEAIVYCKKDGDWEEHGVLTPSRQGRRTDLEPAIEAIRAGMGIREFALEFPQEYLRYRNGWRDLADFARDRTKHPPVCIWLHGAPGTGKSRYAHGLSQEPWSYGGDAWFDGYNGQSVAIFDDFADDTASTQTRAINIGLFLKLTDRYPLLVPFKGGFTNWNPRVIIFTSNRRLEELYFGRGDPAAIRRRFHVVHDIGLGQLEYGYDELLRLGEQQ